MKIQLKVEPRGEFRELQVAEGSTIEELFRSMEDKLPFTIMLAKVDNKYEN